MKNLITMFIAMLFYCCFVSATDTNNELISVTVLPSDGASCTLKCLEVKVKAKGHVLPASVNKLIRSMGFINATNDSSRIMYVGDKFSYDTKTSELIFTATKTSEVIIFSGNTKTAEVKENGVVVFRQNSSISQQCVCDPTLNGDITVLVNEVAQTDAFQTKDIFEGSTANVDTVNEDSTEVENTNADNNEVLNRVVVKFPCTLNIDKKLDTECNSKKEKRYWKKTIPLLIESYSGDSIEFGRGFLRNILCTDGGLTLYDITKKKRNTKYRLAVL